MKLNKLTNADTINLIENASELKQLNKYQSKDFVEDFIGLSLARSGFYGILDGESARPIKNSQTSFNSKRDFTILIEGYVELIKEPVNTGTGIISYTGYGVLVVGGSVVYDGRVIQVSEDLASLEEDVETIEETLPLKADLVGGLVPAEQLPSYVDDIIEVANYAALPDPGEAGKIYITLDTGNSYRWSGSVYVDFSASINQTQTKYVDSIYGSNAGNGTIAKPYQTPEHAITQIDPIIETFSANTTLNSNSIFIPTGLTANMTVGRMICGTGIPYGTTIIGAGSPNALTISQNATANGTGVSLTVEEEITIKTFGNFEITASQIFKDGVNWDFGDSVITWGDLTLFDITTVLKHDFKVIGGRFVGIHANSYMYRNSSAQNIENIIEFNNMQGYSITTSYLFYDWVSFDSTFKIRNCKFSAPFGRLGKIAKLNNYIDIQGYALLSGFELGGNNKIDGIITTPSSILAFYQSENANRNVKIDANIFGSLFLTTRGVSQINGDITGDSVSLGMIGSTSENILINGAVVSNMVTKTGYGTITINGKWSGNISLSEGTIINNSNTNYFNIAITGNGRFINNADFKNNGGIMFVSINGANAYFENNGFWYSNSNGQMVLLTSGKVVNKGTIEEGFFYAPIVQNGGTFINDGTLIQSDTGNPNACLIKSAGTFVNDGGQLKTVGSKSPIKCTADTSASKDIYVLGCTTNCDGTTYGLLFAFDGGSFAPNPIILNNLNEATTYIW
jgi:hypothetical protein